MKIEILEKILPEIVNAVVEFNKTGIFPGFDKKISKKFNGVENGMNYNFQFTFNEFHKSLDIKTSIDGNCLIDLGIPVEKISKDTDILEAIKEEIDLILCHWESVLDEFKELLTK